MSNEIVPQKTGTMMQHRDVTLSVTETAIQLGKIAWASGICRAKSEEAAAMIMLKGYELGFPMTASFDFIEVIENRVGLKPMGALALMRAHPEIVKSCKFTDLTDSKGNFTGTECEIIRWENGEAVSYKQQFTLEEAKTAGLLKSASNWEKYPRNMCRWRALGFCADVAVPDLMAGMTGLLKMPEEITDAMAFAQGDEPLVIEAAPVTEAIEAPKDEMTLSELIARFDPSDILATNKGVMPRTNAECAEIAKKLKGEGK